MRGQGRSRALSGLEGLRFEALASLEDLPEALAKTDAPCAALALYFHRKRISAAALRSLSGYVADGGGLLAIHSATASFKDTPAYFEILGGRFSGHGPLTLDGVEVALGGYPRYGNRYVQAAFDARQVAIEAGGRALRLDWESGAREARG